MGLRILKIEQALNSFLFIDSRGRIVDFIMDLASWCGQKMGFNIFICVRIIHQRIAMHTGASRQTVTNVHNNLQQEKLIDFY